MKELSNNQNPFNGDGVDFIIVIIIAFVVVGIMVFTGYLN